MKIQFTTFNELIQDCLQLSGQLPPGIVAVCGVPRSGMLPATILATQLHVPLCESSTLAKTGEPLAAGKRINKRSPSIPEDGLVLLVEDCINEGYDIQADAQDLVRQIPSLQDRLITAAVYATSHAAHRVTYHSKIVELPRLFQWNWLNQGGQRYTAWDIDGALCFDPWGVDSDDGGYEFAIANARPLYLPKAHVVPLIVTNRLERHRPQTEQWLNRYGVRFNKLIMNPAATAYERDRVEGYPSKLKADAYAADDSLKLFVESHHNQAKQIHQQTGKPVLCSQTFEIFQ